MPLNQLKRALWVLSKIVDAGANGISYEELSHKWDDSPVNDAKRPLSERTFYRLRNELESLFDVDIDTKSTTDNRYVVAHNERSVFLGLFGRLVTEKSSYSPTLQELTFHVMKGMDISPEERTAIEDIAFKLTRVAYETLGNLIKEVENGRISGADRAQWADIKYHACIWLEETFQRIATWVGVGVDRKDEEGKDTVRFYIVNETDDKAFHARLMEELDLLPPEQLDGKFWWFAPRDEHLRSLLYSSHPDMARIKSTVERLCSQLNSLE